MSFRKAGRDDDERLLRMLALRDEGRTSVEIGRAMGVGDVYVRSLLRRVDADLAASEQA